MGPKYCLGLSCEVTLGACAWVIQGCNSSSPKVCPGSLLFAPMFARLWPEAVLAAGCRLTKATVCQVLLPFHTSPHSFLQGSGYYYPHSGDEDTECIDFPKLPPLGRGRTRTETQVSLVPIPLLLINLPPSLVPRNLVWHFHKGLY